MARHKAYEVRERAVDNGWLIPLIGAGVGALLGKSVQSRAQTSRDERWYGQDEWGRSDPRYGSGYRDYDYGYGEHRAAAYSYGAEGRRHEGEGYRGSALEHELGGEHAAGDESSSRLSDKAAELKDRASDVKERVSAKADEVTGRLRERTDQWRERMPDRDRISTSTREDMGLWAFGALALGALFGMALPVSQRERELLEPAKRKVREAGYQARDMALEKGSEALDRAQAKVGGEEHGEELHGDQTRTTQSPIIPTTSATTPIH